MLKCGFAAAALARLAWLLQRRELPAPRVAGVLALVGNLSPTADGQAALLRVKLDRRGDPPGVGGSGGVGGVGDGVGGRGAAHMSPAHCAPGNAGTATRGTGGGSGRLPAASSSCGGGQRGHTQQAPRLRRRAKTRNTTRNTKHKTRNNRSQWSTCKL